MTVEAAIFRCSICGEPSSDICVACTKDACGNHRCERCKRCSDCCECDVPLSAAEAHPEPEVQESEIPAPESLQPESQVSMDTFAASETNENPDFTDSSDAAPEPDGFRPPNDPLI